MGESHVEVFATTVKIEGVIKVLLEPIINFEGNDEAHDFPPIYLDLGSPTLATVTTLLGKYCSAKRFSLK